MNQPGPVAARRSGAALQGTVLALVALATFLLGVWSFDWTWFVITAAATTAAIGRMWTHHRLGVFAPHEREYS